jgi:transcriptional regulator with XRE-family HTH domain
VHRPHRHVSALAFGYIRVMKKTNFHRYLGEQLRDPAFAARFERAGEARDVALQIAALRQNAGLSQQDLAKLLKTSQQQISRLESPAYEGHSLSMLRRVARAPCTRGCGSSSNRKLAPAGANGGRRLPTAAKDQEKMNTSKKSDLPPERVRRSTVTGDD